MGAIGRGEDMEITTYLETAMTSELQGNVTDLCPVGALLPKPQNFRARPWEYEQDAGVDVMDALGSAIRIDTRGREVMRILPRVNEAVNEEWISDKTRQIVDGLKTQRLDRPFVRENGKLQPASWSEAFAAIAAKVKATTPGKIGALAAICRRSRKSSRSSRWSTALASKNLDCASGRREAPSGLGRASYLFNATVAGIDHADALLIIGSNPRWESPVLNARIRKRWRAGHFPVALIGERADLTYDYDYLGAGPDALARVAQATGFWRDPRRAERPLVLVGQGALARDDGAAIARCWRPSSARKRATGPAFPFCTLRRRESAGSTSASCRGRAVSTRRHMAKAGALDLVFLVSAPTKSTIAPGAFVVYIGTHGDRGAHRADVILPGAAYTEKSGTYVNTEGRVQMLRPRRLPARRRARGLGDLPRPVRRARTSPCRSIRSRALRSQLYAALRISRGSTRSSRPTLKVWPRCRRAARTWSRAPWSRPSPIST